MDESAYVRIGGIQPEAHLAFMVWGWAAVDGTGGWVFIDFCESTVEGYGYSASRGATARWRARVLSYRAAQQRAPSYIGNFGLGAQKEVAAGGSS